MCLTTKKIGQPNETSLLLPLPNKTGVHGYTDLLTLQDLLQNNFGYGQKQELLEHFVCGTCSTPGSTSSRTFITSLPSDVIIRLCRNRHTTTKTAGRNSGSKNNREISFPSQLDMAPYFFIPSNKEEKEIQLPKMYHLVSLLVHVGKSTKRGHWIYLHRQPGFRFFFFFLLFLFFSLFYFLCSFFFC